MVSEQSPLLPPGDGDSRSPDDAPAPKSRWARLGGLGVFVWALAATAAVIVVAVWTQHVQQTSRMPRAAKRSLILMVSDGMGPASLSLTRSYRQLVDDLPHDDTLVLDKHLWGASRTRSTDSLVTDSAAGATAFACGKKSYNGAIAVLPDHQPCGTVLEAAKRAGYMTGLVVTTDVTDATPACFASHVLLRQMQDEIALHEIGHGPLGRSVDLILGGGRCHFLPNTSSGSCRGDDVDVARLARDSYGWSYADSRDDFDALGGGDSVELPMFGLFAPTDVPFELDRRHMSDVYPSLSDMAKTALRALDKATAKSDKGFFLMIEGSRIDHAGHINDPAAQVHEVLEYDKTFKVVLDYIRDTNSQAVLVATSDHETGGLATALQEPGHYPVYNWYPQVLANASASCEKLAARLQYYVANHKPSPSPEHLKSWINSELMIPGLGIVDATDDELNRLASDPGASINTFAAIISRRAHIGWSTHGHSAVDVNIYSSGGPETEKLRGNVENTDIGKFLSHYLDVDVDAITEELKKKTAKNALGVADPDSLPSLEWATGGYHVAESL